MSEVENEENKFAEDQAENVVVSDGNKRIYELGYLIVPTVSEESVPEVFGNFKELIVAQGGEIISSEMPRMIRLAYVMDKVVNNIRSKFDTAYFGWVKFEVESVALAEIKKRLDLNNDLIRFLITKTVRENTLAPRKFAGSGTMRSKNGIGKKEENTEVAPIDKEEIDKEIDALLVEEEAVS